MDILIQASQFILSLSILVLLHELGHFIPAKLFKTRVEKFYLFFDPYFSLFKYKHKGTEYGIGWLPLGGYVKIAGMVDESLDTEQLKKDPEPWEFRSKPAWQRLIIMVGGVTVNVILAVLIYSMVLYTWGEKYLTTPNAKYGIYVDANGEKLGLRNGDKVLTVGGKPVENFMSIPSEIILSGAGEMKVLRNGAEVILPISNQQRSDLINAKAGSFIQPAYLPLVKAVSPGMPAEKAGILAGDQLLRIGADTTQYFNNFAQVLQKYKGKTVEVVALRNGQEVKLQTQVTAEGRLGFEAASLEDQLTFNTKEYGFFQSFPAGYNRAVESIGSYLQNLKTMFTVPDAHKQIGGFISLGKIYDTQWNWFRFWNFTAFLSIILAIMNMLPIPALDGGHVMFLLYEMITGRKPNEKVLEYAQYAGMILLLGLMLYANGNDVIRLISGQ